MTAPVLPACLAEVMEESCDSYTVGRDAARVSGHVFIYLKRVLSKPTILFMVTVAPAFEVVGGLKVCDDGFDAGAPGGAEDAEDTFFAIVHVRFVFNSYRMIDYFLQTFFGKYRYLCVCRYSYS